MRTIVSLNLRRLLLVAAVGIAWLPLPAQTATPVPIATTQTSPSPQTTDLISASPTPSATPVSTETTPEATPLPPRSVMLVCRFAPGADFTPAQKQLLFESLTMRLGTVSAEIRVREYPDLGLSADADLNQMAILSGVDAWISAKVSGNMNAATIHVRAYDLQKNQDFFEMDIQGKIDPRFRNAFSGLWAELEKQVAQTIHQNRQINQVTITAPEHTIVEIDTEQVVGPDQTSVFKLAAPASYFWRAYLPGNRPQSGQLFVDSDKTINVQPKPYFPVQFDIGLEWLSFPVIRFLLPLLSDDLNIDISLVFYNFGIAPSYPTDPQVSLIHDFHMINFLYGVRWYPLKHRYEIRPWFGAGAQFRFLTNSSTVLDSLSPGGFYLQFGVSLDVLPELAVFLEFTPRFTYTKDPELAISSLAAAGRSNSGFNQTVAAGSFLIEPWHFILGVRLQP